MINFEQLNVFIAAVKHGSFSAAARALGRSHTAVGLSIGNLEDYLGVKLFDRTTKKPTLTPAGERLHSQSKVLFRQVSRIEDAVQSHLMAVEDEIVIGLDELIPFSRLENVIERVSNQFPYIRLSIVRLSRNDLKQKLSDGLIQIAITCNAESVPETFDFINLPNLEFCFICAPDSLLADMESVSNDSLLSSRQIFCHAMLDNPVLSQQAILSSDNWVASQHEDVVNMVEHGIGWAIAPKELVVRKIESGSLVSFTPEFCCTTLFVYIDLWTNNNLYQGKVEQFIVNALSKNEW
ncbi:LysR family transcriptional regulator [Vibrio sp. 10N.261.51.F12]|uniref:LysR family transcriptional regulator n=1 Tax=Vibrio sp. 10N.261.51.F12 TaxID=3229679 RepID=UPI00354EF06C